MLRWRALVIGGCLLVSGCGLRGCTDAPSEQLRAIEARLGGRIGVYALDLETGREIAHRADERFAMASTFKALLAAAVLYRVGRGQLKLDQRVALTASDILEHAPDSKQHLAQGFMTIEELCRAIVVTSDNTAANLLLRTIGGPEALTRFIRGHDDGVTRLDRIEPALNSNLAGDARDTTSPRAMALSLKRVTLEAVLTQDSRQKLLDWMQASQTGAKRIRKGLPDAWLAGDKTGTGANGAANDIAVAWSPSGKAVLIAIYMSGSKRGLEELSAAHAEIAALIVKAFRAQEP